MSAVVKLYRVKGASRRRHIAAPAACRRVLTLGQSVRGYSPVYTMSAPHLLAPPRPFRDSLAHPVRQTLDCAAKTATPMSMVHPRGARAAHSSSAQSAARMQGFVALRDAARGHRPSFVAGRYRRRRCGARQLPLCVLGNLAAPHLDVARLLAAPCRLAPPPG